MLWCGLIVIAFSLNSGFCEKSVHGFYVSVAIGKERESVIRALDREKLHVSPLARFIALLRHKVRNESVSYSVGDEDRCPLFCK